jgi:hypothetical protein
VSVRAAENIPDRIVALGWLGACRATRTVVSIGHAEAYTAGLGSPVMSPRKPPARWRWTPSHSRVRRILQRGPVLLALAWKNEDDSTWSWKLWRDPHHYGPEATQAKAESEAKFASEQHDMRLLDVRVLAKRWADDPVCFDDWARAELMRFLRHQAHIDLAVNRSRDGPSETDLRDAAVSVAHDVGLVDNDDNPTESGLALIYEAAGWV